MESYLTVLIGEILVPEHFLWRAEISDLEIIQQSQAQFNLSIPAHDYMINNNGTLDSVIFRHNYTLANSAENHGQFMDSAPAKDLYAKVIFSKKWNTNRVFNIYTDNDVCVINIDSDKPVNLTGTWKAWHKISNLYIFAKSGMYLDDFKLQNIVHLHLIAGDLSKYLSFIQNEYVSKKELQTLIPSPLTGSIDLNTLESSSLQLTMYAKSLTCLNNLNALKINLKIDSFEKQVATFNCTVKASELIVNSTSDLHFNSKVQTDILNLTSSGQTLYDSTISTTKLFSQSKDVILKPNAEISALNIIDKITKKVIEASVAIFETTWFFMYSGASIYSQGEIELKPLDENSVISTYGILDAGSAFKVHGKEFNNYGIIFATQDITLDLEEITLGKKDYIYLQAARWKKLGYNIDINEAGNLRTRNGGNITITANSADFSKVNIIAMRGNIEINILNSSDATGFRAEDVKWNATSLFINSPNNPIEYKDLTNVLEKDFSVKYFKLHTQLEELDEWEINDDIVLKNLNLSYYFEYHIYKGAGFNIDGPIEAIGLKLIADNHRSIRINAALNCKDSIYLEAYNIAFFIGATQSHNVISLIANSIYVGNLASIVTKDLVIHNSEAGRTRSVHLVSTKVEVYNNALIKANNFAVARWRTNIESNYWDPTRDENALNAHGIYLNGGYGGVVGQFHGKPFCAASQYASACGRYSLESFQGTSESSFTVYGNLTIDIAKIELNTSSIIVWQTLNITNLDFNPIKNPIYLHKLLNTGTETDFDTAPVASWGAFSQPIKRLLALAGMQVDIPINEVGQGATYKYIYDQINAVFQIGRLEGKIDQAIIGKKITITGVNVLPGVENTLANIAGNGISSLTNIGFNHQGNLQTEGGNEVLMRDPNRPVESTFGVSIEDFNREYYETNYKIDYSTTPKLAGSGKIQPEINYVYKTKYPSLYNCEYGIETIIKELGIDPTTVGKIICQSECQADMIKKIFYRKLGVGGLSDIERELAAYFKANPQLDGIERKCLEIKQLIINALDEQKRLGFSFGMFLNEQQRLSVAKTFLWLIYVDMTAELSKPATSDNVIKVLVPVVYFPVLTIKNGPSFKSAAILSIREAGEGASIGTLSNAGAFLLGKGTLKAGYVYNIAYIGNNGEETATINVSGYFLSTSKVATQVHANAITSVRQSYATVDAGFGVINVNTEHDAVFVGTTFSSSKEGSVNVNSAGNTYVAPSQIINGFASGGGDNYVKSLVVHNALSKVIGNFQVKSQGNNVILGLNATAADTIKVNSTSGTNTYGAVYNIDYLESQSVTEKEGILSSKTTTEYNLRFIADPQVSQFGTEVTPLGYYISHSYGGENSKGMIVHAYYIDRKAGTTENPAGIVDAPAYRIDKATHYSKVEQEGLVGFRSGKLVTSRTREILESESTKKAKPYGMHAYENNNLTAVNKTVSNTTNNAYPSNTINIEAVKGNYTGKGINITTEGGKGGNGTVRINATKGINLEAAEDAIDKRSLKKEAVSEIGITINSEKATFGLFDRYIKDNVYTFAFDPVLVNVDTKVFQLIAKDGKVVTKGVQVNVLETLINAAEHTDLPAFKVIKQMQQKLSREVALEIGLWNHINHALKDTQAVSEADSAVNQGFAAYNAAVSWVKALNKPVSFDLVFNARLHKSKFYVEQVTAVPSQFVSHDTKHQVKILEMAGSMVTGATWVIDAERVKLMAAFSEQKVVRESSSQGGDVTLDLASGIPSATVGVENSKHIKNSHIPQNFHAHLSESFTANVKEEMEVSGAVIDANEVDLNVGSLIIRSIEKIIEVYGEDNSLGITSELLSGEIKPFISKIGYFHKQGSVKWVDELTTLVGKQRVNIIVNGMLHITGAMIANAVEEEQGQLQTKSNMLVKAKQILAETINNYDQGHTLGAAIGLPKSAGGLFGNTYEFRVGYRDYEQVIRPSIIDITVEGEVIGELNQDSSRVVEETGWGFKDVYAKIPIVNDWEAALNGAANVLNNAANTIKQGADNIGEAWEKITEAFARASDEIVKEDKEVNNKKAEKERAVDEKIEALLDEIEQMEEEIAYEEAEDEEYIDLDNPKYDKINQQKFYSKDHLRNIEKALSAIETIKKDDLSDRPDMRFAIKAVALLLVSKEGFRYDDAVKLAYSEVKISEHNMEPRVQKANALAALAIEYGFAGIALLGITLKAILEKYDIDLSNKGTILRTPIYENKAQKLETPAHKEEPKVIPFPEEQDTSPQQPGLEHTESGFKLPGFDIEEGGDLNVLFKDNDKTFVKLFGKKMADDLIKKVNDDNYLKQFEKFKKQDGSDRYECEKQESPLWRALENYKDQIKTNNAAKSKEVMYYRWDIKHKDIEVYDSSAREMGSIDPVTGKNYRPGSGIINQGIKKIIK